VAEKKAVKVTEDPNNVRLHTDKGREAASMSLSELGAGRSIVVDSEGGIIGGEEIYQEAMKLGLGVRYVHTDGTKLIVVKRKDLSTEDERRIALAIADNRVGEHSDWDYAALRGALAQLADADFDFEATGFTEIDFDEISDVEPPEPPGGGGGAAGPGPGGGGGLPDRFEIYLTFHDRADAESWLANNGYPEHNFGLGKNVVITI